MQLRHLRPKKKKKKTSPPEDKHLVLLASPVPRCNLTVLASRLMVRKSDTHVTHALILSISGAVCIRSSSKLVLDSKDAVVQERDVN